MNPSTGKTVSLYWDGPQGVISYNIHYIDVIMSAMASQITGVSIVCWTVCSGVDQRKHQSSASLAFVRGFHRWPVDSPHKGLVTRKTFPFDDVIMLKQIVRYKPEHAQKGFWLDGYITVAPHESWFLKSPATSLVIHTASQKHQNFALLSLCAK